MLHTKQGVWRGKGALLQTFLLQTMEILLINFEIRLSINLVSFFLDINSVLPTSFKTVEYPPPPPRA